MLPCYNWYNRRLILLFPYVSHLCESPECILVKPPLNTETRSFVTLIVLLIFPTPDQFDGCHPAGVTF